jgi:Flp pilus assembly pilin Flp
MSIHFARHTRRARHIRRRAVFARSRRGATAVEYALLIALIGIAIIAGAKLVGTSANGQLTDAGDAVVSLNPKAKPGNNGNNGGTNNGGTNNGGTNNGGTNNGGGGTNPNKPTCPGKSC